MQKRLNLNLSGDKGKRTAPPIPEELSLACKLLCVKPKSDTGKQLQDILLTEGSEQLDRVVNERLMEQIQVERLIDIRPQPTLFC